MKRALVLGLVFASVLMSGCLGRNALFNKVQDWNATATPEPFLNQGISFVFWFFPVYGLTLLGDIVIFNSVEFWTGTNPVSNEKAKVKVKLAERFEDGFGNVAEVTYGQDNRVFVKETRDGRTYEYVLALEGGQVSLEGDSPSIGWR